MSTYLPTAPSFSENAPRLFQHYTYTLPTCLSEAPSSAPWATVGHRHSVKKGLWRIRHFQYFEDSGL